MYRKINQADGVKDAECKVCKSKRFMFSKGKMTCNDCGEVFGQIANNKFGAKKTEYNGSRYDSRFEAECAEILDTRVKANDLKEVLRQVKIDLKAYDKHITNYYIDFIAIHNDGHREYIEAKGMETDAWKLKFKMLEAMLERDEPTAELTLWKQKTLKRIR